MTEPPAAFADGRRPLRHLLWQYSYLQALDFLTTVAFLVNGVKEGNPLIRLAMSVGPSPLEMLLVIKLLAVMLGIYCWRMGRRQVLSRVNLLFALVIAWNLVALIVQTASQRPV